MHSGELGGAAVRVREGRPVARAKNASRADLRNVANPMAAGGEAEQAIYGTVYGERTATTDAKNVASERYAFQIQSVYPRQYEHAAGATSTEIFKVTTPQLQP